MSKDVWMLGIGLGLHARRPGGKSHGALWVRAARLTHGNGIDRLWRRAQGATGASAR